MNLLPLVLSLEHEAGVSGSAPTGPCRFCGFHATDWMRPTYFAGQPVSACLLCALCHGLDRPRIAEEAALIWLPEMTQAALNATVRRLHLICARHGEPPTMDRIPRAGGEALSRAWGVHLALSRRAATAAQRLGAGIAELATLLPELGPPAPPRSALLGGLRLLALGRFFGADDADLYPSALARIATTEATA